MSGKKWQTQEDKADGYAIGGKEIAKYYKVHSQTAKPNTVQTIGTTLT